MRYFLICDTDTQKHKHQVYKLEYVCILFIQIFLTVCLSYLDDLK